MKSKQELQDLAAKVLDLSKADQTEVIVGAKTSSLTRFANNHIHQNVESENVTCNIRTVIGKKVFYTETYNLDDKAMKAFLDSAVEITKLQPDDPDFVSLPKSPEKVAKESYSNRSTEITPLEMAQKVKGALNKVQAKSLIGSGFLSRDVQQICVANSLGNNSYFLETDASFSLTAAEKQSTGYVVGCNRNIDEIDIEALTDRAIQKSLLNKNPIALEPGKYAVILEEEPVSHLLMYLAHLGFGAASFLEKRSFMAEGVGKKLTDDVVKIYDDANHPLIQGMPFDFEGFPRKRVELITNGVGKGVVFDSYTATKANAENTGHALPGNPPEGPFPLNLVLEGGNSDYETLVKGTKKGILLTRMWYNRVVDYRKTILTGMTRDGTFLVEDGEIVAALKNMRFNNSILDALSNVEDMTNEAFLIKEHGMSALVPRMRLAAFNFTGVSTV